MQPSRNPLRLEYVTPEGELRWSEPRATVHELRVLAYELRAAGNTIQGGFRDYIGNPLVGPYPAFPTPPRWLPFMR